MRQDFQRNTYDWQDGWKMPSRLECLAWGLGCCAVWGMVFWLVISYLGGL